MILQRGRGPIIDNLDDLELLSKDELIEMLSERADAGVSLSFPGKAVTRRLARNVRPRVQRRIAKYSIGPADDRARNLILEGDNLQAMTTLYRERGRVNLILTDPPYNTGNDFRYNDKWDEDPNDPGLGEFVSEEDRARHTKWMKFMYPRLMMMNSMLAPTGVLAICIDHRELFRLGQMLDEIFGEANRLAIINWQKSHAPRNDSKHISTATEYVLIYAKDLSQSSTGLLERSERAQSSYRNPDDDPKGSWSPADSTAPGAQTHPGMVYGIQNPFSGELVFPPSGRHWTRERSKMKQGLESWGSAYVAKDLGDSSGAALLLKGAPDPRMLSNPLDDPVAMEARKRALSRSEQGAWPEFYFRQGGKGGREIGLGQPRFKSYLDAVRKGVVPTTYWANEDFQQLEIGTTSWAHEESGHSQAGQSELSAIVGRGHNFETVKPLRLFEKIIQLWCPPDGLVLDIFAGSGTTGNAVLSLNQKAGTSRRFILVEQGRPERGDSYASSLTADRVRRVVTGDWASGSRDPLGGGFEFRQLTKQVDAKALLQMEREEMVDTVIASYFDSSRRNGTNLTRFGDIGTGYLVAKNSEDEGFYLVWDGPDGNTDLTEEVYEACVKEGAQIGLKPIYHVYGRYNLFSTDGVRFYQIPDRILADFGLDLRTESYDDEAAS